MKNYGNDKFSAMGKAALIPGMQYLLELMQEALDFMREELGQEQLAAPAADGNANWGPRGSPRWKANVSKSARKRWATYSAKEKAEQLRKTLGVKPKKPKKVTKTKLGSAIAKTWANMTPAQRRKRVKAMQAGRAAAAAQRAKLPAVRVNGGA